MLVKFASFCSSSFNLDPKYLNGFRYRSLLIYLFIAIIIGFTVSLFSFEELYFKVVGLKAIVLCSVTPIKL
jgi:uncharacterized membrane protein YwzB